MRINPYKMENASVHLEPPGYYIPLWGNKRMTPQFFFNVPFSVDSAWVVVVSMRIGFRFSDGSVHPEHRVRTPNDCVSI